MAFSFGTALIQLLLVVPITVVTSFTPIIYYTSKKSPFVSQQPFGTRNGSTLRSSSYLQSSTKPGEFDYALIFDCDGVIIETEELHRLAYNAAFKAADLQIDGEPVE